MLTNELVSNTNSEIIQDTDDLITTFFNDFISDLVDLNLNNSLTCLSTINGQNNVIDSTILEVDEYESKIKLDAHEEISSWPMKYANNEVDDFKQIKSTIYNNEISKDEDECGDKNNNDNIHKDPDIDGKRIEKLISDIRNEIIFPNIFNDLNLFDEIDDTADLESNEFLKDILDILKENQYIIGDKAVCVNQSNLEKIEEETEPEVDVENKNVLLESNELFNLNLMNSKTDDSLDFYRKLSANKIRYYLKKTGLDIVLDLPPKSKSINTIMLEKSKIITTDISPSAPTALVHRNRNNVNTPSVKVHPDKIQSNGDCQIKISKNSLDYSKSTSSIKTISKHKIDSTKSSLSCTGSGRKLSRSRSKSTPSLKTSYSNEHKSDNCNIVKCQEIKVEKDLKQSNKKKSVENVLTTNEKEKFSNELTSVLKNIKHQDILVEKLKLLANKISLYNYDKQYRSTLKKLNNIKSQIKNFPVNIQSTTNSTDQKQKIKISNMKVKSKTKIKKLKAPSSTTTGSKSFANLTTETRYVAKRLEIKTEPTESNHRCRVKLVLSETTSKKQKTKLNETNFIDDATAIRLRSIFKNLKHTEPPKILITSPKINEYERDKLMKSVPEFISALLQIESPNDDNDDKSYKSNGTQCSRKRKQKQQSNCIISSEKNRKSKDKVTSDDELVSQITTGTVTDDEIKSIGSLTQLPSYSNRVHYEYPEPINPKYVTSETKLLKSITPDIIRPISAEYSKEKQLASKKSLSNVSQSGRSTDFKHSQGDLFKINTLVTQTKHKNECSILTFHDILKLKMISNNLTNYFRRSGRSFETIVPLSLKRMYNKGHGLTKSQLDQWRQYDYKSPVSPQRRWYHEPYYSNRLSTSLPTVDLPKRLDLTNYNHYYQFNNKINMSNIKINSQTSVSRSQKNDIKKSPPKEIAQPDSETDDATIKSAMDSLNHLISGIMWDKNTMVTRIETQPKIETQQSVNKEPVVDDIWPLPVYDVSKSPVTAINSINNNNRPSTFSSEIHDNEFEIMKYQIETTKRPMSAPNQILTSVADNTSKLNAK